MVSIFDVAAYILELTTGGMSTWKLHKLCYFCQAWHYVWEDKPLFPEKFEAWLAGPVAPELYYTHKGKYCITRKELCKGDSSKLTENERETIEVVVDQYGKYSGFILTQLIHESDPWLNARGDIGLFESCRKEITTQSMKEYYEALNER